MYISSTTGRMPTMAAPTAMPMKPCSLMGVSMHPLGAEFVHEVAGHTEEAAVGADVFADEEDLLVAAHLFAQRLVDCLNIGCLSHECVSLPLAGVC